MQTTVPDISIITTCKGRLAHLRQSLPLMVRQAENANVEIVVVDYDCPDQAGDWAKAHYPQVRVVRVKGAPIFNASRARNFGAKVANGAWLLFVDADILLDAAFVQRLLPLLKAGQFYQAQKTAKQFVGTFAVRREDFTSIGGYDEVMQGWGAEDTDLYHRFALRGLRRAEFPSDLLGEITHGDALRTAHRGIRDIQLSHRINTLYARAKIDVMQLLRRELNAKERKTLYQEIEATASKTPAHQAIHVEVTLPAQKLRLLGSWRDLERKLTVSLKPGKNPS